MSRSWLKPEELRHGFTNLLTPPWTHTVCYQYIVRPTYCIYLTTMFNIFLPILSFFFLAPLTMLSRTNTTSQSVFTQPLPFAVTYDFSFAATALDPYIHVVVSADSNWSAPLHWTEKHTEHLSCIAGGLHLYEARSLYGTADRLVGPGYDFTFNPGTQYSWWRSDSRDKNRSAGEKEDLVTHIYTDPEYAARHELFYRNVNSAMLDSAKYPYLQSTPLWVRILLLSLGDEARTAWVAWILRIQLYVMYREFDFWPYLGSIELDAFYTWRPFSDQAPDWVCKFVWRSIHVISHVKVGAGALLGKWVFGMRPAYPMYTPERLRNGLTTT